MWYFFTDLCWPKYQTTYPDSVFLSICRHFNCTSHWKWAVNRQPDFLLGGSYSRSCLLFYLRMVHLLGPKIRIFQFNPRYLRIKMFDSYVHAHHTNWEAAVNRQPGFRRERLVEQRLGNWLASALSLSKQIAFKNLLFFWNLRFCFEIWSFIKSRYRCILSCATLWILCDTHSQQSLIIL